MNGNVKGRVRFRFYVSSSKNIKFNHGEELTLDDLGLSSEDWAEMSQEEREQFLDDEARTLLFDRYIDYGMEVVEGQDD